MGENSPIEWTDHTWNPWTGCTRVSEACRNCYAESMARRFPHLGDWGPGAERKRTSEANWRKPLAWNRKAQREALTCARCGLDRASIVHGSCSAFGADEAHHFVEAPRPRVFCASLADWLDHEVPIEWLADMLRVVHQTPNLDWLLLTKRPALWRGRLQQAYDEALSCDDAGLAGCSDDCTRCWVGRWLDGDPPRNVWLGCTAEDQRNFDQRVPELVRIPAVVHFLSVEPMLGPVNAWPYVRELLDHQESFTVYDQLGEITVTERGKRLVDWVICGGESGHGARPMHPTWVRELRDQCVRGGAAFFFKQWGAFAPCSQTTLGTVTKEDKLTNLPGGVTVARVGKKRSGRRLDAVTHSEFPKVTA